MAILSIQSSVAYGHVGNSVAVPALQSLGFEAWRVDTVAFSNHPAHPTMRGRVVPAAEVAALLEGIAELGVLGRCAAVLTGYVGEAGTAAAMAAAIDRARAANPAALYACDPVIGDNGRAYVRAGVTEAIRETLVPRADILTPNLFELEQLAGHPATSPDAIAAAVAGLAGHSLRRLVAVTGIPGPLAGGADGELVTLLFRAGRCWRAARPRRGLRASGTGDLFAALFLGHYLRACDPAAALAAAQAGLDRVIEATLAAGADELVLRGSLLP
ncbi:MAG: pyridoxal kinase [Thalassobaculales bacterium]